MLLLELDELLLPLKQNRPAYEPSSQRPPTYSTSQRRAQRIPIF